ncbi:hypothetical protein EAG_14733 [Camponotus floridanus]|uniref:Uncharacterized protein n=1 Tax=Camponotus floridanus TaxID=104421 RepID=E2A967_CAMFO|nr:hypothetical protein EAG_14733 [Camponotus floridanus]
MDNQSHQVLHASRFWRQSLEETRVPPDSEHSKSNSLPHFPSLPRGLAELSTTTPNVHDAPRVSSRESLPGDAPGAQPQAATTLHSAMIDHNNAPRGLPHTSQGCYREIQRLLGDGGDALI